MKKRILSLALAFAMMATAIVVPGAKAEAAAVKGNRIVLGDLVGDKLAVNTGAAYTTTATAADITNGLDTFVYYTDGDAKTEVDAADFATTRFEIGVDIKVDVNNSLKLADRDVIAMNTKGGPATLASSVGSAILVFEQDDPLTYTDYIGILGEDIEASELTTDNKLAVLIYTGTGEASDLGSGIKTSRNDQHEGAPVNTLEEIIKELKGEGQTAAAKTNNKYNNAAKVLKDANGFIYAYISGLSGFMTKGSSNNGSEFTLESATVKAQKNASGDTYKEHNVVMEDKTLYVSTEEGVSYDVYKTLELTFSVSSDYVDGDDYNSHENERLAKDSIIWGLSQVRASDKKSRALSDTDLQKTDYDGKIVYVYNGVTETWSAATPGDCPQAGVYDIYVIGRKDGKKYVVDTPVKTGYQIVFVEATPTKWVRLNTQLGDDDELDVAGMSGYSLTRTNEVIPTPLNMDYYELGFTNDWVATLESSKPFVSLPQLATKINHETRKVSFFQGWSTTTDASGILRDDKATLYASAKYYAIWGDTPKANNAAVYRVFNPATTEHLYTGNYAEYAALVKAGWNGEGVKFYGFRTNDGTGTPSVENKTKEVRRMFNTVTGEHIYIEDGGLEMNTLLASRIWVAEKIVFSSPANGDPIYRVFNPAAPAVGQHLWTKDAAEMNILTSKYGWQYEGTPFNSAVQTWAN